MRVDYVVVGSGLTGAVIARCLADAGREVLVLERRSHLGGNVHDHVHPSGIRIHTYGPHYFRTTSERIWRFVNRFDEFYPFTAEIQSLVDGNLEQWPVSSDYVRRHVGPRWTPGFHGEPKNFEEAALKLMPAAIYRKFVHGYTQKQWGEIPSRLEANLAGRFSISPSGHRALSTHRFQGLPLNGYASFMANMLTGIPVLLNVDHLVSPKSVTAKVKLIFTGPIDEYFGFKLGRLRYRGQAREHVYYPNATLRQPVAQVNYPLLKQGRRIRTIEWKHLLPREQGRRITGTVITTETPFTPSNPSEFEYPFPDQASRALFLRYEQLASANRKLLICGRLGEYRYYDMDQAIGRALMIGRHLIAGRS